MHPRIKDILNLILLIIYYIICLFRDICIVLIMLTLKTSYALIKVLLCYKECLKHLAWVGAAVFNKLGLGNTFIGENSHAYFPLKI